MFNQIFEYEKKYWTILHHFFIDFFSAVSHLGSKKMETNIVDEGATVGY